MRPELERLEFFPLEKKIQKNQKLHPRDCRLSAQWTQNPSVRLCCDGPEGFRGALNYVFHYAERRKALRELYIRSLLLFHTASSVSILSKSDPKNDSFNWAIASLVNCYTTKRVSGQTRITQYSCQNTLGIFLVFFGILL